MWETLQKFGLAYCDLPTMMWNVEMMLRLVAVKIEGRAPSIPKIFYIFSAMAILMYIFNYHASMLVFVLIDCRENGNIAAGVIVLCAAMNSLIGLNKLMNMYKHQKKVQSLVAGYLAYNRMPLTPEASDLMASIMRTVKKRFLVFVGVMMCIDVIFNIQPLLERVLPSALILYDRHVVYGLKKILGITNYQIAVINIITCVTFIGYITSAITGFLIVTTGYSEARLIVHGQEMRDIWSDALKHYRQNFDVTYTGNNIDKNALKELNKYAKDRLRLIVQSHETNIELTKKIEDLFRNTILVEFVLITAGLITDLLGGLEDTYILVPYALMQLFMDCYVGQKLIDASFIFENAVYDCKWENFDVHNRRTVLMILKMSQRPRSLSAGGLATLSFASFMAVYRAVYSTYTALRSRMV